MNGGLVDVTEGSLARLTLAGRTVEDVSVHVSELDAFSTLWVHGQKVGLLGNRIFARIARMELDFQRRVVRFVEG